MNELKQDQANEAIPEVQDVSAAVDETPKVKVPYVKKVVKKVRKFSYGDGLRMHFQKKRLEAIVAKASKKTVAQNPVTQ
jgi:hypothetical protein